MGGAVSGGSHQRAAEATFEYSWFSFDTVLVDFDWQKQKLCWIFLESSKSFKSLLTDTLQKCCDQYVKDVLNKGQLSLTNNWI